MHFKGYPMPFTLGCECGKILKAPDKWAGKKAKCAGCGRAHQLPTEVRVESETSRPFRKTAEQAAAHQKKIAAFVAVLAGADKTNWQAALDGLLVLGEEIAAGALLSAMSQLSIYRDGCLHNQFLIRAFLALEPAPLETLMQAVQSNNPKLRNAAAYVVGQLKHPRTMEALVWALEHPLRETRTDWTVGDEDGNSPQITLDAVDYLYDAVGAMGSVAVDGFLPRLHPEYPGGFIAMEAMKRLKDKRATAGIVSILMRGDPPLRAMAADALAAIGWRPSNPAEVKARQLANHFAKVPVDKLGAFGLNKLAELAAFGAEAIECATAYYLRCLQTEYVPPELFMSTSSPKRELNNPIPDRVSPEEATFALATLGYLGAVELLLALAAKSASEAPVALARHAGNNSVLDYLAKMECEAQFRIGAALSKFDDPRGADFVHALLVRYPVGGMDLIAGHLGNFRDPRFFAPLVKALEGRYHSTSRAAAHSLGFSGDQRAVRPLIALVEKSDTPPELKKAAVFELGKLGCRDEVLEVVRKGKDPDLGFAAAIALGRTGDVINALRSGNFEAIEALPQSEDPIAITALIEVLQHANQELAKRAARALSALKWNPTTVEQTIPFALICENVDMLENLGPAAIPAIAEAAGRNTTAIEALSRFTDPVALTAIVGALKSPTPDIRKSAVEALGSIGGEAAINALKTAKFSEPNNSVSKSIAEALKRLGAV